MINDLMMKYDCNYYKLSVKGKVISNHKWRTCTIQSCFDEFGSVPEGSHLYIHSDDDKNYFGTLKYNEAENYFYLDSHGYFYILKSVELNCILLYELEGDC